MIKLHFVDLESNPKLRSLTLEDMKLSDCLPQIINLLSDCKLEGKNRRLIPDDRGGGQGKYLYLGVIRLTTGSYRRFRVVFSSLLTARLTAVSFRVMLVNCFVVIVPWFYRGEIGGTPLGIALAQ